MPNKIHSHHIIELRHDTTERRHIADRVHPEHRQIEHRHSTDRAQTTLRQSTDRTRTEHGQNTDRAQTEHGQSADTDIHDMMSCTVLHYNHTFNSQHNHITDRETSSE